MPRATSLRWVQYPAKPVNKDESEEEVIFLSSSPQYQDSSFPRSHDQAHKPPGSRKPSQVTGTRPSSKDDSSDPEIIEFDSKEDTLDSESIERKADRSVGRLNLPHIRQQPFPWRRPATVHSIHGGRGSRGGTAQNRDSRGAIVKGEEECSPPDFTDTALVDVVGGLPKRLGAGEVTTASYRGSPGICKEKLLTDAMSRTVAEAMASFEAANINQCEHTEVTCSSALLHSDEMDVDQNQVETEARIEADDTSQGAEDEETLECQAVAENCLKILKEETLAADQLTTSGAPVKPQEAGAEEEANSASCDGQVSSSLAEALEDPVENADHGEIAISSGSSSSSITNPEIQSLRQRIDECVAAQGPLREKANEMLRSLHHHRAMLKAARKQVEKNTKSAEVAAQVRQAQLLAELRHSHGQVWQVHAHCIAENLDLKEKLRASLQRREKLLKEIQLVKKTPDFPQARLDAISPPPGLGLEGDDSEAYTSSGETKTDSEPEECEGADEASSPPGLSRTVMKFTNPDEGGKDVLLKDADNQNTSLGCQGEDVAEQPEPEPFKSPKVVPVEAATTPLQPMPSVAAERKDSDAQEADLQVAPPPGLDNWQSRSLVVAAHQRDSRQSGVEVNGRCWVAKANKCKVPGTKGFAKRRLSALSVGMEVEGEILHSSWLGAFVNVGVAIDGFVNSVDMPEAIKLKAGDFVTGLVVREIDLNAPRLLLSAANVVVTAS